MKELSDFVSVVWVPYVLVLCIAISVEIRDTCRYIISIYSPYFILLSKRARIIGKSAGKHAWKNGHWQSRVHTGAVVLKFKV